jgi:transcriptional regulator with XRE-family HTH domain
MKINRAKLIRLRKLRGWDQPRLAIESGLSRPYITQIENGTRTPSPPAVEALATALGVTVTELVNSLRCPRCGAVIDV